MITCWSPKCTGGWPTMLYAGLCVCLLGSNLNVHAKPEKLRSSQEKLPFKSISWRFKMGLIQTQLSVTNLTTGWITWFHKCITEKCQRLHSTSDRRMNEYGALVERYGQKNTAAVEAKPFPEPLCLAKIPHGLICDWTEVSMAKGQCLNMSALWFHKFLPLKTSGNNLWQLYNNTKCLNLSAPSLTSQGFFVWSIN